MTNTGRATVLTSILTFHQQQGERGNTFALVDLILDPPRLEAFIKNALVQAQSSNQLDLSSIDAVAEAGRQHLTRVAADFDADVKERPAAALVAPLRSVG
jgi:hypothetical protein